MNQLTYDYLNKQFGIDADILQRTETAESKLACVFSDLDDIQTFNQYKVLHHFQEARINDQHFAWNTGYGYDDVGRAALEQLYADVFGAEAGLVR
ncbi:MAG: methionine gamma-lyase family protein, partial [Firmicutes bacterium]|nr:methionine gamma-lyase family protein [Bacillota bacterium]